VETISVVADSGKSSFVGREVAKSDRPELTAAKIIVSGGRGVGSSESFKIVEQDHRAVKRIIHQLLLGFESFRSARNTLSGIEVMHMIRKGQLRDGSGLNPAQRFYSLAA
jgi:transposase-like protein